MFKHAAEIPDSGNRAMRLGIGAKFLTLLSVALVAVVGTTVFVAVRLFEKDQLSMAFVTADLLTANKASEVGSWLQEQLKQAEALGHNPEWLFFRNEQQDASWNKTTSHCGAAARSEWHFTRESTSLGWAFVAQRGGICVGIGLDAISAKLSGAEPYEISVLSGTGHVLAHSEVSDLPSMKDWDTPEAKRVLASKVDRQLSEVAEQSKSYITAIARVPGSSVIVRTRIDKDVALETIRVVVSRSFWVAVFFLSIAFMVAYAIAQGIVSPIQLLTESARALASGNYSMRANVKTRDETRDLAETFNHMSGEIERRIEGLSQLYQAAQKISGTLETQALLRSSLESLRPLIGARNALGFYRGPSAKKPILDQADWSESERGKLRPLLAKLQKTPLGDAPTLVEHDGEPYLVAPIREQSQASGFVLFSGKEHDPFKSFDAEDTHMAGAILSSVGTSFENIRLLRETADKARIEKELETAKHVQNTMFPPPSLTFGATQIESFYEPAAECGGDWWGALPMPGSKLVLAVGDATGHGVPSALLTASARATFSVLEGIVKRESASSTSPAVILRLLNRAVRDSAKGKILMTMFVATLHTETGEVVVANASHDPVYRLPSDGNLDVIDCAPGPRLGEVSDFQVEETRFQLSPGETLVLYTDGLPEGLNASDEEYSDRKFQRSLKKRLAEGLPAMRDGVISDFKKFTGERTFADDVTLVLARFDPKNSKT